MGVASADHWCSKYYCILYLYPTKEILLSGHHWCLTWDSERLSTYFTWILLKIFKALFINGSPLLYQFTASGKHFQHTLQIISIFQLFVEKNLSDLKIFYMFLPARGHKALLFMWSWYSFGFASVPLLLHFAYFHPFEQTIKTKETDCLWWTAVLICLYTKQ